MDSFHKQQTMILPSEAEIMNWLTAWGVMAERVAYGSNNEVLIEFEYLEEYISIEVDIDELDELEEHITDIKNEKRNGKLF